LGKNFFFFKSINNCSTSSSSPIFSNTVLSLTVESKEELKITKTTPEENKEIPHYCKQGPRCAVKSRKESESTGALLRENGG